MVVAHSIPDADASFKKKSGSIDLVSTKKTGRKRVQASILGSLVHVFGGTYFMGAFLKLCQDLLTFVSPQILK